MNRTVLVGLVATLAFSAIAEPPTWDELESRVFFMTPHPREGNGVWQLDLESLTVSKLAVAYLNHMTGFDQVMESDQNLVAVEDRLVIQGWPAFEEIDPLTGAILRRSNVFADPGVLGYGFGGPWLGEELARRLGLPGEGFLGRAGCFASSMQRVYGYSCRQPEGGTIDKRVVAFLLAGASAPLAIGELDGEWPPSHHGSNRTFDLDAERYLTIVNDDLWGGGDWFLSESGIASGALALESQIALDDPWFRMNATHGELLIADGESIHQLDEALAITESWDLDPWRVSAIARLSQLPERFVQILPIVVDGPGRGGSRWHSEVWFFNPSPVAMTAELRSVTTAARRQLSIEAKASKRIDDLFGWIGLDEADPERTHDAIVIESAYRWQENLEVFSRISTPAAGGGELGQAVPALPSLVGHSNHLHLQMEMSDVLYNSTELDESSAFIVLDTREPGRFRHNLGFVNHYDEELCLDLVWTWDDQEALGTSESNVFEFFSIGNLLRLAENFQQVCLPPREVGVFNVESLFPVAIRRFPPRIGVFGPRPAAVWLSMIDNKSGDPTFVPWTNWGNYINLENWPTEQWGVIPIVARDQGDRATHWVTDLYGFGKHGSFTGDETTSELKLYPRDPGSCGGQEVITKFQRGDYPGNLPSWLGYLDELFGEGPHWFATWKFRVMLSRVIDHFDECHGDFVAALEMNAGNFTQTFSRTWTSTSGGGSVGGMLPMFPVHGFPVQHLAGVEVSAASRINFGLFNANDRPVSFRIELWSESGALEATVDLETRVHEVLLEPLSALLGPLAPGTYGLTVTPLGDAGSWAYLSIVDGLSNDPINLW